MTTPFDVRNTERVWFAATRAAPLAVQVVLAVLLVGMWLLQKWPLVHQTTDASRTELLASTGIAVVLSLVAAAALMRRPSTTARGIGLGTAGAAVVVLIGAIPYALWLF